MIENICLIQIMIKILLRKQHFYLLNLYFNKLKQREYAFVPVSMNKKPRGGHNGEIYFQPTHDGGIIHTTGPGADISLQF